jgi:cytochrome oxidase Cu insertion factor (SCO1/SenC/PrrC family)
LISGGEYTPLFVRNAKPRKVGDFHLDTHAVTNGEYLEFVKRHPEWRRSAVRELFADKLYLWHWAGDFDLGPNAQALKDAPVTAVSWFAARAYLETQGKRLPTTDEWEYAARADAKQADATKDPAFTQQLLEWYARATPKVLPAVSTAPQNVYGVKGLHGVIWEWVDDFNSAMETGEGRSGGNLERDLFCAGGGINYPDKSNYAAFMRFAFRSSLRANYTVANLGFRGVRSADGAAPVVAAKSGGDAATAALLPLGSVYWTPGVWTSQRGESASLRSLRGKFQIVAMGFTSCQFACPRLMADMRLIEKQLGEASRPLVSFVFASFDTKRDTPENMAAFAKKNSLEHWSFLTANESDVRSLAAVLGVKYEAIEGDFAHSNSIYLLSRDGEILHRQDGLGATPEAMLKAIEKALTSSGK